jgi:hypothetical protein
MRAVAIAILIGLAACGSEPDYLTTEELMDPEACKSCHPIHYREWSGSMHAYAAEDPVFRAMNQRGQDDTHGELGDFCVACHAPVALRLGLTTDGTNLDDVPAYARGVTCYFCHSVDEITGDHNALLDLADDGVLRAGVQDPVASPKHPSAYSALIDGGSQDSSKMCGSCHDVQTPAGVHLERTFAEWQTTIFGSADPTKHLSCAACHMFGHTGTIADVPSVRVPERIRHEHTFAAVDVALTDWPEMDAQREAITRDLNGALLPRLCVVPLDGGRIDYRLDNVAGGHMVPTGVAHDRRMWAEVTAYGDGDAIIFQSGAVGDGVDPETTLEADPHLWEIRDHAFDADGKPATFFWQVRDVQSALLPPTVTVDPLDPRYDHSVTHSYPVPGQLPNIKRVVATVKMRALPYELIGSLETSGHLSAAAAQGVRDAMPTLTLTGTTLEWTDATDDLGGCVNP